MFNELKTFYFFERVKMASKNNLLLLFDRPGEPVFMPKGKDKAVFDVPSTFFTEKYKPIGSELQNR